MIYIAVTRFNETTFQEFQNFYKEKNINNCIYNVPVPIKQKFDKDSHFIVLEMNNSTNEIMGIGLINNLVQYNKYNVYSDSNYNRFCYEGKNRISNNSFSNKEKETIQHLENICFKGKRHLKRGQGIQIISALTVHHYLREHDDIQLLLPLQEMFLHRFGKKKNSFKIEN
tara:strand:- start:256 stop:765 length:510 start_codon:yes stop_codon:yes gene_type:complete